MPLGMPKLGHEVEEGSALWGIVWMSVEYNLHNSLLSLLLLCVIENPRMGVEGYAERGA